MAIGERVCGSAQTQARGGWSWLRRGSHTHSTMSPNGGWRKRCAWWREGRQPIGLAAGARSRWCVWCVAAVGVSGGSDIHVSTNPWAPTSALHCEDEDDAGEERRLTRWVGGWGGTAARVGAKVAVQVFTVQAKQNSLKRIRTVRLHLHPLTCALTLCVAPARVRDRCDGGD